MAKKLDIKNVLNKDAKKNSNSVGNNPTKPIKRSKSGLPLNLKNMRNPKKWYKNPTFWILIAIGFSIIIFKTAVVEPPTKTVDYGAFIAAVKDKKYTKVTVFDYSAVGTKEDQKSTDTVGIPNKSSFSQSLKDAGIPVTESGITYDQPAAVDIFPLLVNVGLTIGAILLLIYFLSKQGGAGGGSSGIFGMGESKARMIYGKKQDINFDSVAGIDESKDELKEVVDFLKNPQKYTRMGARIPKGVLLVGPPGTGKTLLARAVSGEAGVPFFFTSGAEFEELLVGAGAARVRDLFAKAKKASPSIIFIDEIDAMARKRGSVIQSTATEQTLNQILVEMDGFDNNTGILVLAATNRADVLDPAILRPGRFDRRVTLDLPDKDARRQILDVHVKNKPLSKEIDLDIIARRTGGFSGADIENMLNESAIITAKEGRSEITNKDIEEAVAKIMVGPAKKTMATDKDRKIIAYHEAGHAIVGYMTGADRDVHRITIIARGSAGGYTEYIPHDDDKLMSKEKMTSMITSVLAGNATEKLIFNDTTTGASDDFEKATSIARRMITKYGMGDIGPMVLSDGDDTYSMTYGMRKEFSEKIAEEVDRNVQRLLNECYDNATELLKRYKVKLERVVQVLFEKETIEGEEFKAIMAE
ncbi:MAG: ATP-dependent zinc metalloprotease FtsH [bacterium]